ncbi:EAL domain-containing protein [Stecheria sp. CLA-KB-P133]|uniref:EAL domain-containing protein n=1 Tax=Grylomicrobium aquisgranensis TaxID=2926318 RepID=A0AB35U6A8_9FIRM|nr:EAL domain-containing protein [Stecheria sp. CLA-KB-P133]
MNENVKELDHYRAYYDLIDGGVLFVLADGTERIVFANTKAASLYECTDPEELLQYCSSCYQNLMEEEDYKPLSQLAEKNPDHIHISFHYRTQKGHFRKIQGTCTLKETAFGKTYVLLLFSSEQITGDLDADDKTGVPGMHDFFQKVMRQIQNHLENHTIQFFCPVSFDVTCFKEYNRLYGMQKGDQCLRKIAETISGCFPGSLLGHLTGDHFVALLPSEDLETKLEHVCREVNSYINDDGIQLKAGIYQPSEEDTLDIMKNAFDAAKTACDSIKTDGNKSIAVYRASMGDAIANKNYVLRHFSEALDKHYIKVYYQPVIRTLTGKICGFEALARWEDPQRGMIFPDVFIPVLENAQLINRLDQYVLEQVCRLLRDRMDNGLPLVPVSMNLSAYDFEVSNPIDTIEKLVKKYGIPRTILFLEITERVMFQSPVSMAKTVHQFQQGGYQVWMDDFGSEYSSLNSLHNYHFDVIKIDMGFFRNFDDRSRQIITSVVTMARMLRVQTLAEGVETQEQVSFLKKIGCGRIQGYYYGKPMNYENAISFIHARQFRFEMPNEAQLMNAAESVNVVSDSPTALFSFDGTTISLLNENDAYKRELRSTGTQGMAEANANLGDESYPFRGRFQQLLLKAFHSKTQETLTYADNGQYMSVNVRWIAGDESYWVGEAHLYNISNNKAIQQAKALDSTLRDIFQFYEGFYQIDRGRNEVKILRSNHPELSQQEDPCTIREFIRCFSDNLVDPDDRERFVAFMSACSAERKMINRDGTVRRELVRIRNENGTYRWTVFEALVNYKSAAKNILLCEREDIWEKMDERDQLLPLFLQSFGSAKTTPAQQQTLAQSSLFRALCEDSPYMFFWKDRNGKILGISKALKEAEGIQDASAFAGKTEQEIGFCLDADGLNPDREKIPYTGYSSKELALIGGRVREADVVRVPWYQEKEISGSLTMVEGDRKKIRNEESRLGFADHDTGLLSFRGAIEAGLLYADHYRLRKDDYVGLLIDVPAFSQVQRDSEENARAILNGISDALRKSFAPGWAISRIGLCCFLCFCRRDSAGNIGKKIAAVSGILPPLWKRFGIQTNPELTHAAAYGSEVMSLDEMLQLLIRRQNSAEKELFGEKPYTEDRLSIRREILDSLPERVVISDPKTYEIVYMNHAARKDVSVDLDSSLDGCYCYKVLEGYDAPCKNCPNLMLRMDCAYASSHMVRKTGERLISRSFLISWEKRVLKATFAFNLNEYLDTLTEDRDLFYQEMHANEAITSGLIEADPQQGIEKTISSISQNMKPERFLIFEEGGDNTVSATYEWTAPGIVPLKEELQSIPLTELRALYARFAAERLVMVRDMKAFQQEHPDFSLRISNVHSFVSGRLLLQNETEGFTLVINPSEDSLQKAKVVYSTLTDFIAVMVRNKNSMRELKRQSMIDELTGTGNRRALEYRIRKWQGDGVLGVISTDLNGLKNTNDSQGHHAGDMLIMEDARILRECAGERAVFRTGGDEFIVLTENLEESDIHLLIQHIRDSAANNGISMAIGYASIRGKATSFDALLTKADFNMYKDKKHSYRRRKEDQ